MKTIEDVWALLDEDGQARMVDVGAKPVQVRTARATALFACQPATIDLLRRDALPSSNASATSRNPRKNPPGKTILRRLWHRATPRFPDHGDRQDMALT
jgi:hypothetical protein